MKFQGSCRTAWGCAPGSRGAAGSWVGESQRPGGHQLAGFLGSFLPPRGDVNGREWRGCEGHWAAGSSWAPRLDGGGWEKPEAPRHLWATAYRPLARPAPWMPAPPKPGFLPLLSTRLTPPPARGLFSDLGSQTRTSEAPLCPLRAPALISARYHEGSRSSWWGHAGMQGLGLISCRRPREERKQKISPALGQ